MLISLSAEELADIARGKTVSRSIHNSHGHIERIHIGNEQSVKQDNSYNSPDWVHSEDHR